MTSEFLHVGKHRIAVRPAGRPPYVPTPEKKFGPEQSQAEDQLGMENSQ